MAITRIEKPIVRRTATVERSAAVIVELHPTYLRVRHERGQNFEIEYRDLLNMAHRLDRRVRRIS